MESLGNIANFDSILTFGNSHYFDVLMRLTCAVIIGGIIGLERSGNNQDAGLRTHVLVCLGAAGIMTISEMLPYDEYDYKLTHEEAVEWLLEEFIQHKPWGATLMEVGYPVGRDAFNLKPHLSLWDKQTETGIMLTNPIHIWRKDLGDITVSEERIFL